MKVENNLNFKGYKNVISSKLNFADGTISIISGQLDNVLSKDLDKLQEIYNNFGHKTSLNRDVFTIIYSDTIANGVVMLNEKVIPSGQILKALRNGDLYDKEYSDYQKTESTVLKFYTLFASIFKRMMNDNVSQNYNSDLSNVLINSYNAIKSLTKNDMVANDITMTLSKKYKYQTLAKDVYSYINNTMRDFFK